MFRISKVVIMVSSRDRFILNIFGHICSIISPVDISCKAIQISVKVTTKEKREIKYYFYIFAHNFLKNFGYIVNRDNMLQRKTRRIFREGKQC